MLLKKYNGHWFLSSRHELVKKRMIVIALLCSRVQNTPLGENHILSAWLNKREYVNKNPSLGGDREPAFKCVNMAYFFILSVTSNYGNVLTVKTLWAMFCPFSIQTNWFDSIWVRIGEALPFDLIWVRIGEALPETLVFKVSKLR